MQQHQEIANQFGAAPSSNGDGQGRAPQALQVVNGSGTDGPNGPNAAASQQTRF